MSVTERTVITKEKVYSSATEVLDRKQRMRERLHNAWLAAYGLVATSFAILVGGAIADSTATVDVGLAGVAAGFLLDATALVYYKNKERKDSGSNFPNP